MLTYINKNKGGVIAPIKLNIMKGLFNYLRNFKEIHSIKPYKIVKLPTGLIVKHYRNGRLIAQDRCTEMVCNNCVCK